MRLNRFDVGSNVDAGGGGCGWVMVGSLVLTVLFGCETDSFMDPSVLGRWEQTPVVLPILERLDVVEEPESYLEGLSSVETSDLIPVAHEYVIGPGDVLGVTIFELITPDQESVQVRQVDDLGNMRLPMMGSLRVAGTTPSELEKLIADKLDQMGILKEAIISVTVQAGRQNMYTVVGDLESAGSAIGTYTIPKTDYRLLDAVAQAQGVRSEVTELYVIRQVSLIPDQRDRVGSEASPVEPEQPPAPLDPTALIEELLQDVDETTPPPPAPTHESDQGQTPEQSGGFEPPTDLDDGLRKTEQNTPSPWVFVEDRWVRAGSDRLTHTTGGDRVNERGQVASDRVLTQRIIEVPYDKLLEGDMRYNLVIRPGDIIRIPTPSSGNIYVGGAISRPGTYTLPGENSLTLKQLIFAAGNVSFLAIPERVDLIRRLSNHQEAVVRLNLRAIFEGTQPDFYLKPNDTINIGTNFAASPLSVIRNGFRATYGFGFLFDRNFAFDVFGSTNNN